MGRFAALVEPEPNTGCWLWSGSLNWRGYGRITINGSGVGAHRLSYELHVGSIADDLEIDHLCRVRSCVNPRHLEAIPHALNVQRAAATRPACSRGHEFTEANTRWVKTRGGRICRKCSRQRDTEGQKRRRHEARAANTSTTVPL